MVRSAAMSLAEQIQEQAGRASAEGAPRAGSVDSTDPEVARQQLAVLLERRSANDMQARPSP